MEVKLCNNTQLYIFLNNENNFKKNIHLHSYITRSQTLESVVPTISQILSRIETGTWSLSLAPRGQRNRRNVKTDQKQFKIKSFLKKTYLFENTKNNIKISENARSYTHAHLPKLDIRR